ncbi:pyrroloquinoline quinone biosynthesis peptide chaperone PqqD [Fuscibacter oryzae]|uniref:Pyrroloquinoline quinone biosynthesis peptide chaperone PqqD n=1 Tax=Fuscibacter oryzae TaxID=2803939 RepID=A0A8J7MP22_9RHOB|nr:pyrroloquinoline quinone biosynthesis peptide chaperone PqqD [Fuscibacter oryzae]MBL4926857.1 pyrroloquinoline quinone biosynthesis peptide chaperone PqqD [Fuscibacter oryzae]
MTPATVPHLPRGVRLHHDRVRGTMVLLAPERALMLDEVGAAILGRVDGAAEVGQIAESLAQEYDAPLAEVSADVAEFLSDLARERLVDLHG